MIKMLWLMVIVLEISKKMWRNKNQYLDPLESLKKYQGEHIQLSALHIMLNLPLMLEVLTTDTELDVTPVNIKSSINHCH